MEDTYCNKLDEISAARYEPFILKWVEAKPSLTRSTGGSLGCTTTVFPSTRSLGKRDARAPPSGRRSRLSGDQLPTVATKAREPVLSEREVRLLIRTRAAGDQFAAELNAKLGLKESRVDHLVYTKMDRTLPLTAAHKAARMKWAEVHILNPDGPDGFKFYWRDMRRPLQSYLQRQNGGGSVMVWGAFSAEGKSKLVFLKGRQNSGDYIYTISEYMLPFAHSNHGTDFVFQQDNASIHASRETTHFLKEMEFETMVWPARSPDCNPIENEWSVMAARVYVHGRQYSATDQLEIAIH
ncbi:Transposase [Phytophthora palmivora]|uniref:Transposase n=1 Tax=Phytophthora palmivora TaxID=4796 RepID=A0A2P4WX97_9STRA|nr:Transposase [Phytophthora palmivora]